MCETFKVDFRKKQIFKTWYPFCLIGLLLISTPYFSQAQFRRVAEDKLEVKASIFENGIISKGIESDNLFTTFTPDGRTVFFVRRVPGTLFAIYTSEFKGEKWSEPQKVEFSGQYKDQGPFLSPDGKKLFFYSNRPLRGTTAKPDDDIWVVERKENGKWSKPQNLGESVNTDRDERNPSVDKKGNLYFWSIRSDTRGESDIYRSQLRGGKYSIPENLGDVINTKYWEANPSIDPNGKYMFFTSDDRPDGFGKADIYITYFRRGRWTQPKNLGQLVNSGSFDFAPSISKDGKYLFFSSNRSLDGEGMGKQNIYRIEVKALGLDF